MSTNGDQFNIQVLTGLFQLARCVCSDQCKYLYINSNRKMCFIVAWKEQYELGDQCHDTAD